MPPLFWLDVAALSVSLVIAASLTLMVLGVGLRFALSRSFALFTLAQVAWAVFSLLMRLALWLEKGNPLLMSELITLVLGLTGPCLLIFTVCYLDRRTRWTDLAAAVGLAMIVALSVPLFRHQLVSNPRLDVNGTTLADLSAWGFVVTPLPLLYIAWSLVLFWQERRRTGEPYLALSVLILLVGYVVGGVLEIRVPVTSVTHTLSVAILGYGVTSRQLFNPLRERTAELQREIAERMRAEEALRESEQRFRTIFDSVNDAIFVHDLATGDILDVNRKMCEMYGYTREEVFQVNVGALSAGEPPYTQQDAMAWMRKAAEGEPQLFEWRAKDKGGRLFWVEVNMRRAAIGGQDRLLVAVRDITERKRAEQVRAAIYRISEAAQAAQNLDELFRSIHAIVSELMPANNFYIALHDASLDLLSFPYHVDEFDPKWPPVKPGRDLTSYVLRTGRPLLATPEVFEQLVKTGQAESVGAPSVDWLGVPLKTQPGETIGMMAVQTYTEAVRLGEADKEVLVFVSTQVAMVVERKRAEEEREQLLAQIQEQARRVQQIVDTVPEGVLLLDAGGRVVLANPLGERDLVALAGAGVGYTLSYLGDRPLDELLISPPKGLWHEVAADGRSFQVIARPIETGPTPGGWVLVTRDVTQEREVQRRIQQQERLAAVGQLAAGIAHDFNNLLTAINGFAELMGSELLPDDPRQELVEKILGAGRRAANLVRQLLAFSRQQVIQPQVVDLNEVVANVDKMLRRIIGEDIELETSLAPGLWRVKVDPTQIEQVVVNLAVNARDAMPTGGRLIIETANIVLDEGYVASHLGAEPGEHVRLAISDTGIGMSKEVQAHIFEPFFTTKERGKGTGLGLATIFGIVKQSGGHIEVYSEEGAGTVFKIYLPRAGEAVQPWTRPEVRRDMPSGDETILLVEDDPEVRDLARRVFHGQGYTLLVAQDGPEALRLAAQHTGPIHLLVTDVVMPGLSGKALAEQLAQTHPDLRILFMSGYTDNAIAHHGVLDPGVSLLQKPFRPIDLARKVRAVLDASPQVEA